MSNRELAKGMIDRLPEDKMIFVINILENIGEISGNPVYPEFTPNEKTLEAIAEVNEMVQSNSGQHFQGTAEAFNDMLLSED